LYYRIAALGFVNIIIIKTVSIIICRPIGPTGLRLRHTGKTDPVQFYFRSGCLTCSARTGFRAMTTPLLQKHFLPASASMSASFLLGHNGKTVFVPLVCRSYRCDGNNLLQEVFETVTISVCGCQGQSQCRLLRSWCHCQTVCVRMTLKSILSQHQQQCLLLLLRFDHCLLSDSDMVPFSRLLLCRQRVHRYLVCQLYVQVGH